MSGVLYDEAFPTFDEEGNQTDWYVIGYDPSSLRYFDEDSEAMDRTNYEAITGGFDSEREFSPVWLSAPDERSRLRDYGVSRNTLGNPEDFEEGTWFVGTLDHFPYEANQHSSRVTFSGYSPSVIIVRKVSEAHWSDDCDSVGCKREHPEASEGSPVWIESGEWQHYEECKDSLEGYPLLDEDSYSALESEAWERCLSDFVIRDTARDAARIVAAEAEAFSGFPHWFRDSDDYEALAEEHSDEWISEAHSFASEFRGFSGEYDSETFVRVCSEWLVRRSRMMAALERYESWQLRGKVSADVLRFVYSHASDLVLGLGTFRYGNDR